jgi:nicotinamidase-related amidase
VKCSVPKFVWTGGIMALIAAAAVGADSDDPTEGGLLKLHTRRRVAVEASSPADAGRAQRQFRLLEKTIDWQPAQTALIICDMWDQHWCRGAERRVAELAGPMNRVVDAARKRGVFVIHAPSTTVDFYEGTPQRRRAQQAPHAEPPVPLSTSIRWGTAWCWPDKQREPDLPIDDSDMGCDCAEKCEIAGPWTRQIAMIEIKEPDAITDNGQELYNLLEARGIEHMIIMGVHLNMCVLGRPFAIRQLTHLGKDVVLVRDMTDTMYNSQMRPFVNHFAGTDLVVEHVEKFWCPTITSVDLVGGRAFAFADDRR